MHKIILLFSFIKNLIQKLLYIFDKKFFYLIAIIEVIIYFVICKFNVEYNLELPTVFQDTVHISTKLKTRLLNSKIVMKMEDKIVSVDHIRTIIKNYTRDKHLYVKAIYNVRINLRINTTLKKFTSQLLQKNISNRSI